MGLPALRSVDDASWHLDAPGRRSDADRARPALIAGIERPGITMVIVAMSVTLVTAWDILDAFRKASAAGFAG
jgi:hypothetical protein